jgi:hypothetical protein
MSDIKRRTGLAEVDVVDISIDVGKSESFSDAANTRTHISEDEVSFDDDPDLYASLSRDAGLDSGVMVIVSSFDPPISTGIVGGDAGVLQAGEECEGEKEGMVKVFTNSDGVRDATTSQKPEPTDEEREPKKEGERGGSGKKRMEIVKVESSEQGQLLKSKCKAM